MIKEKDWEMVQKVQKAISDWGQHKEINEAISFFKEKNSQAYKILIEMANIEARKSEEAREELKPLFFNLKKTLS